ncbi:AAA family ATPase [Micromonospora haikouensis]|uniref:AAA family ATPase n=1 Tax=Micromonospora haikouensis TaxID=686309 RepID=UPI003D7116CB
MSADRDYDNDICGDPFQDLFFSPNHPDAPEWQQQIDEILGTSEPVPDLIITVGLPGAGKTTWAKGTGHTRVNRDELRDLLHGVRDYTPEHEQQVTIAQEAAVAGLLRAGITVVADDTNLHEDYLARWEALAAECGARLVIVDHFLAVPAAECIHGQADRPARERVSAEAITSMAARIPDVARAITAMRAATTPQNGGTQ